MSDSTVATRFNEGQTFYTFDSPDPVMTTCPPWCQYIGSHRFESGGAEDRTHAGERHTVDLQLEDPVDWGVEEGKAQFALEVATVYAKQNHHDAAPSIHVGKGDLPGMTFTVGEALQLITALQGVIAEVTP